MEADLVLLSRYHRDGDAGAFQSLVEAHGGMVLATARRITRDAALAEEVAQDTFLALARQGHAIREAVAPWLHRVAWQKACNARRGEQRRLVHERDAAQALLVDDEPSWSEVEPLVDEVLDELPEPARSVVIRHFLERRTQRDIARELGLSQPTVSRQIEAGLMRLRVGLRRRGALCGAGLAGLLAANSAQAAPAPFTASMGKLAAAGIGTASAAPASLLTSIAAMTTTTKLLLAASASAAAFWYVHSTPDNKPVATARVEHARPAAAAKATPAPPEVHRYRPAPVAPAVEAKVDAIIARHQGLAQPDLAKSKELEKLAERFSDLISSPEAQEHIEEALKNLSATRGYEHGTITMNFGSDGLASPLCKAWLEAVVSDSPELAEKWFLARLEHSTFDFALDPSAETSSEGVTMKPRAAPKATTKAAAGD